MRSIALVLVGLGLVGLPSYGAAPRLTPSPPQATTAKLLRCRVPGGWRNASWGRVWIPGLAMDIRPESLSSPNWRHWSTTMPAQDKNYYGPTATARLTSQVIEITSQPMKQYYEAGTVPTYSILRLTIVRRTLAAEVSEQIEPSKGTFTWRGACVALPEDGE
jgi:hypothetical protein